MGLQNQLTKDLQAIDNKYDGDIKAIQDRIQTLRNQANVKTEDIDERIDELEAFIDKENTKLEDWRNQKFQFEKEYRALEAEVGPIKYIAEFIYGEEADRNLLESAVRWVIIIIVIVFRHMQMIKASTAGGSRWGALPLRFDNQASHNKV